MIDQFCTMAALGNLLRDACNAQGADWQHNPDYEGIFNLLTAVQPGTMQGTIADYQGYQPHQSGYSRLSQWTLDVGPPISLQMPNLIDFPAATADGGTLITHWSFSYNLEGQLDFFRPMLIGELSEPVLPQNGVAPVFSPGAFRVVLTSDDL